MEETRIRVVVGEGESPRKGLLRFVLEGDGYDVVAEASTTSELARAVADHEPDVVVLDDGIGATTPQLVREISPRTKIVLVWPGAVVPIGGDARVEPSQVLRQLGTTVAKVAATIAGLTTIERPEWVEKVRKDPATLREMLERRGGLQSKRPSVTELQRRGQRLHPAPPTPGSGGEDDGELIAPVVPLTSAAATEATIELPNDVGEPVLHLPDTGPSSPGDDHGVVVPIAAAALAAPPPDDDASELNRRLGAIALGGAAVIGAVVLALAVGGARAPTEIIVAEGPRATIAPGPAIDSGIDDPGPGTPPDEDPSGEPGTDGEPAPGITQGGDGSSPGGTSTAGPDVPPPGGGTEPPPEVPSGGAEPPPELPDGGGWTPPANAPGRSAEHNPHGAPPGQTSGHQSSGGSGSHGNGPKDKGPKHGEDGRPGHSGEHGQGAEHGKGLDKPWPRNG